jgi:hypothetical protein
MRVLHQKLKRPQNQDFQSSICLLAIEMLLTKQRFVRYFAPA